MSTTVENYWKSKVEHLVNGDRSNIILPNGLELYTYDRLLPGMTSWQDYYLFLSRMIQDYSGEASPEVS